MKPVHSRTELEPLGFVHNGHNQHVAAGCTVAVGTPCGDLELTIVTPNGGELNIVVSIDDWQAFAQRSSS